jgi:hypothetical protein
MTSNFCYHELIFYAALLRLLKLPKSLDAMKDIPQAIVYHQVFSLNCLNESARRGIV